MCLCHINKYLFMIGKHCQIFPLALTHKCYFQACVCVCVSAGGLFIELKNVIQSLFPNLPIVLTQSFCFRVCVGEFHKTRFKQFQVSFHLKIKRKKSEIIFFLQKLVKPIFLMTIILYNQTITVTVMRITFGNKWDCYSNEDFEVKCA